MRIKRREVAHIPEDLSRFPAVLARIYAARGVQGAQELDQSLQRLASFDVLKDVDKACQRLYEALKQQEKILIVGDFDADGATSTAVAIRALKNMGAKQVDFLVPNRFEFGYGLSPALVEYASNLAPKLIITVDNGIVSFDGVTKARELGIDVIVTDHHMPADSLPDAVAVVNPNRRDCSFPSKSIAGVGVIFYVMLALRRYLSEQDWFNQQGIAVPNMAQLLDLVALGTVADVVALDHNNRVLVNQGLLRIREKQCSLGLQALFDVAGRNIANCQESDLGFAIAPRLNAAGRLDDMSLGISCLICEDAAQAKVLAESLDSLNVERRNIEAEMKEQAQLSLAPLFKKLEYGEALPKALCLFDASFHQGVIGILAGRLKERYHRPTIVFAEGDAGEIKGSARSVSGLNIRDALAEVERCHPGLLLKFGGHAMAAGLTLRKADFERFRKAFVEVAGQHLDDEALIGTWWTDGDLPLEEFSLETAELLKRAGPWGAQFPEPSFDGRFEILDQRIVGQHHLKLTVAPIGSKLIMDAIAFQVDKNHWPNYRQKEVHMVYRLDINQYQGRRRLQLMVDALMPQLGAQESSGLPNQEVLLSS